MGFVVLVGEVDEAVAGGLLTEEQGQSLKLQVESRGTMQELIDEALASGEISQEMADLLSRRTIRQRGVASYGGSQMRPGGVPGGRIPGGCSCDASEAGSAESPNCWGVDRGRF